MTRCREDRGFALVEVLVAIAILTVGVLGTMSLVDGANNATSGNKAREGATSLSREMIELSRSIVYRDLNATGIATALQTRTALADSSPAEGYTIGRRGFTYTVTIDACSLDDAKDGLGSHDAAVTFCSDSAGPVNPSEDRNTDDYRRVAITLAWSQGGSNRKNRQTTVVPNPAGGLGPSVTNVALSGGLTSPITNAQTTSASFDVTTASTPASVSWYVNGDKKGNAAGSGTAWAFTWQLGDASGVRDGTYIVQAQAFDSGNRSGLAFKRTVVLNRFVPQAPGGFAGGRNGTPGHVDLEWQKNPEGDVIGYRIYRSDSSGNLGTRACPPASDAADAVEPKTSCVDQGAATSGTLYYVALAVDTAPDGARREGTKSSVLSVGAASDAPSTPTGLTACTGGQSGCNGPDGTTAPSGTTVLSWTASTDADGSIQFYRIYRDGSAYDKRYARLYPVANLVYIDPAPGGTTHDYRVSAVDNVFTESLLTNPVNR